MASKHQNKQIAESWLVNIRINKLLSHG